MSVKLECDAPGCAKSVAAVLSHGKPEGPDQEWWVLTTGTTADSPGRYVVGCCDRHLTLALGRKP